MLISTQRLRVNEQVRARRVRLINHEGKQVGVVPIDQALQSAREVNLDLVEVSPNADPPVCKLMDFGKHLYQQRKREQDARKKQHQVQIKEVRLRPKTDQHDRDIKMQRARDFLGEGHRVQIHMLFRGREMQHLDLGRKQMMEFAQQLSDIGKVEGSPNFAGRRMTLLMTPLPSISEAKRKQKQGAGGKKTAKSDESKQSSETVKEEKKKS